MRVTYTATEGYKLLGSELGAWLSEITPGNATGAGVSEDLSGTAIDLDASGTVVKAAVESGAELVGWGVFSTVNYLSRAYGADLDMTAAVTVCGWVKTPTITGTQGIAGNLSAGASGDRGGYGLRLIGSKLEFAVSDSAGALTQATDSADFPADTWVFVAGTLSTAGDMLAYKNGVAVGSAASASIDATAELFQIGAATDAGSPANAFAGSAAVVKVYGAALTAAQILAIYEAERELFYSDSPYTRSGASYDVDLSVNQAIKTEASDSTAVRSLAGRQETTFRRRDTSYQVNIIRQEAATLPALERFLHSIERGEIFTLDRYGSVATPDRPVSVIADPGHVQARQGVDDYYTVSILVREA